MSNLLEIVMSFYVGYGIIWGAFTVGVNLVHPVYKDVKRPWYGLPLIAAINILIWPWGLYMGVQRAKKGNL